MKRSAPKKGDRRERICRGVGEGAGEGVGEEVGTRDTFQLHVHRAAPVVPDPDRAVVRARRKLLVGWTKAATVHTRHHEELT